MLSFSRNDFCSKNYFDTTEGKEVWGMIDLDIYRAFVMLTGKHKQGSEVNFLGNVEKLSAIFSCCPFKYMLHEY